MLLIALPCYPCPHELGSFLLFSLAGIGAFQVSGQEQRGP